MTRVKSNIEWKMWGKRDPLWAVAAWKDKQKEGASPWTDAEFYEVGRQDWEDFWRRWSRYGVDTAAVIEIGCGAGRLTKQMSTLFQQVHALDVSAEMIAYAKERIDAPNVQFHVVEGDRIPLPDASVTAVLSSHVFQHLDSIELGLRYFEEIARVLKPGGTVMLHMPILSWPAERYRILSWVHGSLLFVDDMAAAWRRHRIQRNRFSSFMRMLWYPQPLLFHALPRLGFADVEICTFATRSNQDPHPFVLARKL